MAGDTVITVVGNLTADPELRFTPSGSAVANFTVASTPRIFNRQNQQWEDQEALFLRCSVWRDVAENTTESLIKGSRVIVQGRLKQRSYETREGEKRSVIELEVDEIGPSLRYATAKPNRTSRGGGGGGNYRGGQSGSFGGGQAAGGQSGSGQSGWSGEQAEDPWATGPAGAGAAAQGGSATSGGAAAGGQGGGGSWGGSSYGEDPPF